ncbi:hypothetical protein ACPB8Q_01080 [Methanocaldococcus indicus]|uniref:hypothetical protein n=1 Tax=Methanocaldococcus indicus TaxID=213231 RepID=UPI003C6D58A7
MKCPYCGSEECINKSALNIYLKAVETFLKKYINIKFKYPAVGEVGICKKTGGRIYLCPYCKVPFKAPFLNKGEGHFNCPNCNKTLNVPASNKLVC